MQGVGFRPFVVRLACQTGLTGFVRNESSSVIIEAQGGAAALATFARGLFENRPSLSRIDRSTTSDITVFAEENGFSIQASAHDTANRPTVTPDVATCGKCLAEIREKSEPRFGYALTNCTECGPRYSIICDTPYDRAQTTMRQFGLCEKCHQQYFDPADRRFHAQPIACPICGPMVEILLPILRSTQSAASDQGCFAVTQVNLIAEWPALARTERVLPQKVATGLEPSKPFCRTEPTREWICLHEQPIAEAAKLLLAGRIVAIKGIGGYHLAVRADDEKAVAELRRRKHRDAKPFALLVADIAAARQLVRLSARAEAALASPAAPIVLAPRLPAARVADSVAPDAHRLGVMLPYTPLQSLLLDAMHAANGEAPPLVMTSGNLSDEPLIKDDEEAEQLIAPLCDAILRHDREIERCVDDSVLIDMGEKEPLLPVRRSRGYVPQPIRLLSQIENRKSKMGVGLCLGGELKNTLALLRDDEVILSQHLGDLKHPLAFAHFRRTIVDFCRLFKIKPQWIAHDLHPAYVSSDYAQELARQFKVPTIAVQHHHAHAASVLAEHAVTGEALAMICDGAGYGSDGTIWGGELLRVNMDAGTFARLASLPAFMLPGADAGAKETRRAAAGLLHRFSSGNLADRAMERLYPDHTEREQMQQILAAGFNCPQTSAAGRWFDAVAAILGAATHNRFEGEAPMRLEAMASEATESMTEWAAGSTQPRKMEISDLPALMNEIIAEALAGGDAKQLAMKFHLGFAFAWAGTARRIAGETRLNTVALSGGCFCNQLLTRLVSDDLASSGIRVLRHQIVPPNDGGISLGQAAVAAAIVNQKGWH